MTAPDSDIPPTIQDAQYFNPEYTPQEPYRQDALLDDLRRTLESITRGHDEFVVIVGPTGHGKTTILRTLHDTIETIYDDHLDHSALVFSHQCTPGNKPKHVFQALLTQFNIDYYPLRHEPSNSLVASPAGRNRFAPESATSVLNYACPSGYVKNKNAGRVWRRIKRAFNRHDPDHVYLLIDDADTLTRRPTIIEKLVRHTGETTLGCFVTAVAARKPTGFSRW